MLCESATSTLQPDKLITGPGIKQLEKSAAETLFVAIEPWVSNFGKVNLLLAGMVGSNLGWREAPYLSCPLDARRIGCALLVFEERGHRVAIVPGVSCVNALGQPDVMRGEETQILGWMSQNPESLGGTRLLCLPGTHTKWVQLADGELQCFTTSLTGELFSILRQHSVLIPQQDINRVPDFHADSFRQGVRVAIEHRSDLLHAVFSTRVRGLIKKDEFFDAGSYLSGLLIGFDVQSALNTYQDSNGIVELIGAGDLSGKFAMAIEQMGYRSKISDGNQSVFAGFAAIAAGVQH
jgi:2-dehydro-3-deoxygalactonokinase